MSGHAASLRLVRAGIDTYQQPVVYMHRDCEVCRSEGFAALTRVQVRSGGRELVATLNVVTGDWLAVDVAALSEAAWSALDPGVDALANFAHPEPPAEHLGAQCRCGRRRLRMGEIRESIDSGIQRGPRGL